MAHLLFTDDADGIMAWLDTVSRLLNPSGALHYRVTLASINALFRAIPPPPPSLQERWTTTVWSMPNEPFAVYLIRCLAHHFSITKLAPHLALDPSAAATASAATPPPAAAAAAAAVLESEMCQVVGLRLRPFHADLAQTGWDSRPCACCRGKVTEAAKGRDSPPAVDPLPQQVPKWRRRLLPLSYGGELCVRCGQALPLTPVWTRRRFLVLQRANGTRTAAIAMGDDLGAPLSLGQRIHMLFYATRTENQQPFLVIHAAEPVAFAAPPLSHVLPLVSRWSFADLCRAVCPVIMGQEATKGLLLLATVHTLYRWLRAARRPYRRWQPLHLLVLGPAKCGKSTLLQGTARLYGPYAEAVASTVIQRKTSAGGGGSGGAFADCLPSQAGGLLLCGAVNSAAALCVDDLASCCGGGPVHHAELRLKRLLEVGGVCVGSSAGVGCDLAPMAAGLPLCASSEVHCGVQLVAGAPEESRLVSSLAPLFPLVARVTPQLSLAHTTTIGHAAIAASLARSSLSRSASSARRGRSTSSCSSQQSTESDVAGPCRLSAEVILALVAKAPDPAALEGCVNTSRCNGSHETLLTYYTNQLTLHAGLIEANSHSPSCQLPPPASLRGLDSNACGVSCLSQSQLSLHLRTLAALTQARLVLAGGHPLSAEAAATDVWGLYLHHLRSTAQQLDVAAAPPSMPPVFPPQPPPQHACSDLASMLRSAPPSSFLDGAAGAGLTGLGSHGGGKRRRSKKASKLLLVELMLREQQRGGGAAIAGCPGEAVCPFARAEVLYRSLGGAATLGDTMEMVLAQMQQDGLLIRRPSGWRVTGL